MSVQRPKDKQPYSQWSWNFRSAASIMLASRAHTPGESIKFLVSSLPRCNPGGWIYPRRKWLSTHACTTLHPSARSTARFYGGEAVRIVVCVSLCTSRPSTTPRPTFLYDQLTSLRPGLRTNLLTAAACAAYHAASCDFWGGREFRVGI